MGSKRLFAVKEIDKRVRRAADLNTPLAIGGATILATPQHALDGPEHLEATATDQKLATEEHSGLLLPLSGDPDDRLAGDGSWLPDAGGVTDHGALLGLADDDHPAYVKVIDGGVETVQDHGNAGATETIDLANGNSHAVVLNTDCTFTFAGATNSKECSFTLELTEDGTGGWTPTWPGSVVFPGSTTPAHDTTPSSVTIYVFRSRDGGVTWYGFRAGGSGASGDPVEDTAVWMPLTSVVAGEPVLVWDTDNSLIPTLVPA